MLVEERHRIILEKLFQNGQILVNELARELAVSDETIRRDINALDKERLLRKVRGGAVPIKEMVVEQSYALRTEANPQAKRKIGACAAQFVEDNDIIAFGLGTVTTEMARELRGVRGITVLTASIPILNLLIQKKAKEEFTGEIIFLGGVVNMQQNCVMGIMTTQILENISIDKAFLGATTISPEGVHTYTFDDQLYASLVRRASQVYVLAESHKFDKRSLYKPCDLDAIHHVVTDREHTIPPAMLQALEASGVRMHYAE